MTFEKTNLAQVAQIRDQRKREGVRVIAVHVPQSQAEKDPKSVRDAITRLNLTEPCALDNDTRVSQGYEELPAYFLFRSGRRDPQFDNGTQRARCDRGRPGPTAQRATHEQSVLRCV